MPRRNPIAARAAVRASRDEIRRGTLLVVIPAFNEAANLPRVVSDIRRAIAEADVLVVNDGSRDST